MKALLLGVTGLMTGMVLHAQTVVIDSLESTGKLTATVPAGSVYSVEWIGALDSTNGWQKTWSHLRDQKSSDGTVIVEVPMAYRLTCWTNGLLLNPPVGRTYHYSISHPVGETWVNEVRVMGDTYIPSQNNNYRTIWKEDWYAAPDLIPVGAQSRGAVFMRAEEDCAYLLDSELLPGPMQEDLVWTNGPVGTAWSYFDSTPHTTIQSTIVATNVTVTVGSSNYTGCIEIHSVGDPQPWLANYPIREYTEWIQPNGYIVKSKNWWVDNNYTNAVPIVSELQYWEDL